jgi:16S rRNA C967 or C1407 C5-methylase (RsmB/RsmF family)
MQEVDKKLKQFLELMNESLSKKDFLDAFQAAIKQILEIEKKLIGKIDAKTQQATNTLAELQNLHKEVIKKIEEENTSSLSNIKKWAIQQVGTIFTKNRIAERFAEIVDKSNAKMAEVDKKMAEVKDGNKIYSVNTFNNAPKNVIIGDMMVVEDTGEIYIYE